MSQTCSPSTQRHYGLARVCRVWELARSTVYLHQERRATPPGPGAKRGPKPRWSDEVLVDKIQAVLTARPSWAKAIARCGPGCGGKGSARRRRACCG